MAQASTPKRFEYPKAPKSDTVEDYHGTRIADPFRPLESLDSKATREWIQAQNAITRKFLDETGSREEIRKRLTQLWDFERVSPPVKEGGRYFFARNDGLQNQPVLCVLEKLGAEPRVLLDPNTLARNGTVALSEYAISPNGKLLAYGLAKAGSDWTEWRIRDVDSGTDLPDQLRWIKFSGAAWTADSKGFYYSRYEEPARRKERESVNKNQKLYFHRTGTPQSEDSLVYERSDDPELGFSPAVSNDGRYLIISVWKGTDRRNRLYYKDLRRPGAPVVRLFDDFDAEYIFVDNVGPRFFLRTTKEAPRGKVVSVDVRSKTRTLKTVIPETADTILSVSSVGGRFVVHVMRDASSRVRIHSAGGTLEKEIGLPALGTADGFSGKRRDQETFFSFTSFTVPSSVYRYDFTSGKAELYHRPKLLFDPNVFTTEQVFISSKDGTKVPLFIVSKKDTPRDGSAPAYLYGYGGFNVSMTPSFSVRNLTFVERGGVYVQACLRGGGEYGDSWHRDGMLEKKQNVFDDFVAAAEWLISKKITSKERLSIGGGSNGGLLIGAVLNQRPDLFAAAIPAVGVMDMLRFHKFTIGWAWVSEYGSPDKPDEFRWIYAYSPLHNIQRDTPYPAVLIVTADHDDRVVPAHSFKYAAAMQEAQSGPAPILIRIETQAGHGVGKPTSKLIEESADVLAFLETVLSPRRDAAAQPGVKRRVKYPAWGTVAGRI